MSKEYNSALQARVEQFLKDKGISQASMTHMYVGLNDRMKQNQFIGNVQIEFIRQFDPAAADRYAGYREAFSARRKEQEREKDLARQAEEDAQRAKEQAELAAKKAKYLGWVDDMTPLRFG